MSNYRVQSLMALCVLCAPFLVYAETATTTISVTPPKQCADMIDNDGDGFIDHPSDPGCVSSGDDDETDPVPPQCSDGADNDLDGFIDYPSDSGCSSALDDDETDPVVPSTLSGGGTSYRNATTTIVSFAGLAFPSASLSVLRDGTPLVSGTAAADGSFSLPGPAMTPGSYVFTVIAQKGTARSMASFLTDIVRSNNVSLSAIFLPPVLAVVPLSKNLFRVSGITVPGAELSFLQGSGRTVLGETVAGDDGRFSEEFAADGAFQIAAAASARGLESILSPFVGAAGPKESARGDMNGDGRVNLVDFSILVYWYQNPNAPKRFDLSGDGGVSLEDISVLLFYWTG